jgi:hypothetical protein
MQYYSKTIPDETLEKLTDFLEAQHKINATFSFHQDNSKFLSDLKEIFKNIPEVRDLIKEDSYIVTRKVNKGNSKVAFRPHFDNYSSTLLIPLKVPDSVLNGDIILWENARRTPGNVLSHFFSKLLFQNPVATKRLVKMFQQNKKFVRYSVKPGDFVHFDGFTGLHFNLNVDSGERMSLLIHNNKKFANSFIVRMIEKYSQYSVK